MRTHEVLEKINEIRLLPGGRLSNMYRSPASYGDQNWDCLVSARSICLFYTEGRAQRMQFVSADADDLAHLLKEAPSNVTVDIIGRDPAQLSDVMAQGGFSCLARMQRLSVRDISPALSEDSAINKSYGTINSGGGGLRGRRSPDFGDFRACF